MRIVRTVGELRDALRPARSGRIGLVPTMGALHEGHLSLIRAARAENDTVVVSVFVNPKQFEDTTDFAAYPRTEEQDTRLAEIAGADLVFAPDADEMYPPGFATTVTVAGPITETLEGIGRGRGHFDGMATIVAKLLLAALAEAAYFGAKDAQQVAVVSRMVADLGIPTRIVACPTIRGEDGLALSSRNLRLAPADRRRARAIPRALQAVCTAVGAGQGDAAVLREAGLDILAEEGIEPDYLAFVDPATLEEVGAVTRPTLLLTAAVVGEIRLIDNVLLTPEGVE